MVECSSWRPDLQNHRRGKRAQSELNPMTAAEVEQAALAREHAAFGFPGRAAGATLDCDGEPMVHIRVRTGPATPSAEERALHEASGHVPHRSWCQWCIAARAAEKPQLRRQQPETDEAVSRIEFDFAELGREEDQVLPVPSSTRSMSALRACQQHCVPRKHSVSIWWKPSWRLLRHSNTTW